MDVSPAWRQLADPTASRRSHAQDIASHLGRACRPRPGPRLCAWTGTESHLHSCRWTSSATGSAIRSTRSSLSY